MGTLVIIGIIVILVVVAANAEKKRKRIAELKEAYDNALKGTDKKLALECGRAYYQELRYPKMLTVYDEQAITNDLSTMK